MNAPPGKERKIGQVEDALLKLQRASSCLDDVIMELEQRFSPILLPDAPSPPIDKKPTQQQFVELAAHIGEQAERVVDSGVRLLSIIHRCAL